MYCFLYLFLSLNSDYFVVYLLVWFLNGDLKKGVCVDLGGQKKVGRISEGLGRGTMIKIHCVKFFQ